MDKYEIRRTALINLRDQLGRGGISKIAASIGKAPDYVSRMLYPPNKKGGKRIGEDSVELLNEAFPGWLNGDPKQSITNTHLIQQFDVAGAMGNNGLILESEPPGIIKSWAVDPEWIRRNVRHHTGIANLCIVTGFGPSMKPRYNPGDPLLVDCGIHDLEAGGDGVYFFRVNEHGFIKQLQRIPTPNGIIFRAKSFNKDFDPFDITPDMDFHILGKVLMIWKSEQM
ncbi:MAG: hypothetical protein LBE24_04140 [Methylobacillus sp.]|jgi:hypothetical protein|nr:hypothetical protein [Methylobacillus sp.]